MQFFFEFSNSNFISFFQLCNSDFNLFNFVIVIFIILLLLVGCGKGIAFWKEKHDFIHISSTNSIGRKLNDTDSLSQTYQHNNWLLDCASAVFSVCKLQLILRAGATLLSNWRLASATSYSTLGSLASIAQLSFKNTLFSRLHFVLLRFRAVRSPQTENNRSTYACDAGAATRSRANPYAFNNIVLGYNVT